MILLERLYIRIRLALALEDEDTVEEAYWSKQLIDCEQKIANSTIIRILYSTLISIHVVVILLVIISILLLLSGLPIIYVMLPIITFAIGVLLPVNT